MTYALEPLPKTETPSDYLRLQFDPKNVPSKRIVGLLACQRDPLLRNLRTRVINARPAPILAVPMQKGKGIKKKDKSNAGTPGGSGTATPSTGEVEVQGLEVSGKLWEVEMDDTVIFPEGGGQPSDMGSLNFIDPNGGQKSFRVEMCIRKKLESVHLVRVPSGEEAFWENIAERCEKGKEGVEVDIEVDWDRRTDQMTIHTAQHLLSAVLDLNPLPTLSWAMHAHPSLEPPYIELSRQLTWAEAEAAEKECNRLIAEARRIWIEVSVQGNEGVVRDGDAERESRGLPKDYAGGVIRHCCIDQTDRNACCGTQLPHLGLCSFLHVIPPSLPPDSTTPSKSATKLFFTAGPRASRYLSEASRELSSTCQALHSSRSNVSERAVRNEELRKESAASGEALRKEIAKLLVDSIAVQEEGEKVVWIHRDQKGTHDFEFLGMVAMPLVTKGVEVVVITSALDGVSGGLLLVQSKDDKLAKDVKDRIGAEVDGLASTDGGEGGGVGKRVRGGGAKGRYMCKVEGKFGKREKEDVSKVVEGLKAAKVGI